MRDWKLFKVPNCNLYRCFPTARWVKIYFTPHPLGRWLFLQLAGIYTAFRYCKYRSLVVAWLCCLPLTFATMAPIPVLTELTGVFYNNPLRTEAMTAIALIPLLTLGFLEVAKRISLHGREVLAAAGAVFLAATGLSAPLLLGDTRQVFFPNTSDA